MTDDDKPRTDEPAERASDDTSGAASSPDAENAGAEPAGAETSAETPAETSAEAPGAAPAVPPADETRRERRKRRKAEKKAAPRRKAPWWELPALILLAVGIAIVVKTFVVQPFYIPSESMEKTLHGCTGCSGDRILVNKPIYSVIRDPEPGDIVVFDAPDGWDREGGTQPPGNPVTRFVRGFGQLVGFVPPDGEVLVKRVIAVGGQTVKGVQEPTSAAERRRTGMDTKTVIMISTHGRAGPYRTLAEPYTYRARNDGDDAAFGPVTVPKDRLWVMGDHRTASADSRYHCTPGGPESTDDDANCDPVSSTVPVDKVIGKAFVIAWPPSRWTTLGTPNTFENTAALAGPALPAVASAATVLPVFAIRRRRRNRPRG